MSEDLAWSAERGCSRAMSGPLKVNATVHGALWSAEVTAAEDACCGSQCPHSNLNYNVLELGNSTCSRSVYAQLEVAAAVHAVHCHLLRTPMAGAWLGLLINMLLSQSDLHLTIDRLTMPHPVATAQGGSNCVWHNLH